MGIERPYLPSVRQFHFVGIGGIGMSGIAQLLLELGYKVSGSDIRSSPLTQRLIERGAVVHEGHSAAHLDGAQAVVVSSAVPPDNPEVIRARRRSLPIVHRSEMLAELMSRQRGLAVLGSHGKSTTTSMIGVVFRNHGVDPTVVVGGELNDLGGNARLGRGDYFIAEVDESDGSLLNLQPDVAIVTNIEGEHLDYYGSEAGLVATFEQFLEGLPESGRAIICGDCPNALRASASLDSRRLTYGLGQDCDVSAADIHSEGCQTRFTALRHGKPLGEICLGVPGRQNVLNALATVVAADEAGIPVSTVAESLSQFHGIRRRFQRLGEAAGVVIVDDYAHHPSEIRVTLRAAREAFPDRRLVCAFQPHRYTRTQLLGDQFGEAFHDADLVLITDVYPAGEPPLEGVSGETVLRAVRDRDPHREVHYTPGRHEVNEALSCAVGPGDLVMTMGAGDIWHCAVELAKQLGVPLEENTATN